MATGMRNIKRTVDETKREFGGRSEYARYLKIEDGETAELLFLGDGINEPKLMLEHGFRDGSKFSSIRHRTEHCVACAVIASGDRRVSRASTKACFTLFDMRWAKKTKDAERTARDGKDRFKFEPITEDDVSDAGIKKGVHVRRGRCGWKMPGQWAQAVDAVNARAGRRCKSCGKGKITILGYLTKSGKKINRKAYEEDELVEMLDAGKIVEQLECNRCEKPIRTSIFNSVVAVTRSGSGTNTSYQFSVLPDDVDYEEVFGEGGRPDLYDWDAVDPELSANAQAALLGVKNPFGKSSRKDADLDDEDEDGADDYDDEDPFADDEEEKPKKKSGSKKSKAVEPDDEDDLDDDDEDEPPAKTRSSKSVSLGGKRGARDGDGDEEDDEDLDDDEAEDPFEDDEVEDDDDEDLEEDLDEEDEPVRKSKKSSGAVKAKKSKARRGLR